MKMRNMNQTEMARSLGVSQSYIANKLRLLTLDEATQKQIEENQLTERHARALLRLKSESDRQRVLDKVCKENLSVAETESLVDLIHFDQTLPNNNRTDILRLIHAFEEKIKKDICILNSLGIHSTNKISYENGRVYISICVDENCDF
jgi:ParB family chromosome partitioning protein